MGENGSETPMMSDAEIQSLVDRKVFNEVRAEIDRLEQSKRSAFNNIMLLVVSLSLFVSSGLLKASWLSTGILVVVLFVHESGHWLGMKLLGYRNLSMFFIPYFGAAVSGKKTGAGGVQEIVVALLGPVPGIVLGCVAAVLYVRTGVDLYLQVAQVALFLNVFNLLPFLPLDGGHVWDALLFSRHPLLEAIFRVVAVAALGLLAYVLSSFMLGLLAAIMLFTTKEQYFYSKKARWFREGWKDQMPEPSDHLPDEYLEVMLPHLGEGLSPQADNKTILTGRAMGVWERLFKRPPGLWSSLGLGLVYGVFLVLGVLGIFIAEMALGTRVEVVKRTQADGRVVSVEVQYFGKQVMVEHQLNGQGLYEGLLEGWYGTGQKEVDGLYTDGFRDGKWTYYEIDGKVKSVEFYERGRPVKYQEFKDGDLRDVPPELWPSEFKNWNQTSPRSAKVEKR